LCRTSPRLGSEWNGSGVRRPGLTTDERKRLAELEREVKELKRANEILKAASAFFVRELDPRLPR
jgi:transposase